MTETWVWIGMNSVACAVLLMATKWIRSLRGAWWRIGVVALLVGGLSIWQFQPLWLNSLLIAICTIWMAFEWRGWSDAYWNTLTFLMLEGVILISSNLALAIHSGFSMLPEWFGFGAEGAWVWLDQLQFEPYVIALKSVFVILFILISSVLWERVRRMNARNRTIGEQIGAGKIVWKGMPWFGTVFIDSGNQLRDPVSGKTAVIMEVTSASRCWRNQIIPKRVQAPLHELYDQMLGMNPLQAKSWRVIPYRTIQRDEEHSNMGMLAFRADRIELDGRLIQAEWVALTEQQFCGNEAFQVIYPLSN